MPSGCQAVGLGQRQASIRTLPAPRQLWVGSRTPLRLLPCATPVCSRTTTCHTHTPSGQVLHSTCSTSTPQPPLQAPPACQGPCLPPGRQAPRAPRAPRLGRAGGGPLPPPSRHPAHREPLACQCRVLRLPPPALAARIRGPLQWQRWKRTTCSRMVVNVRQQGCRLAGCLHPPLMTAVIIHAEGRGVGCSLMHGACSPHQEGLPGGPLGRTCRDSPMLFSRPEWCCRSFLAGG